MSGKPKVTIDGVDMTEQVAAMYDAIVGSMDWGSDFLDDETVEAIQLIGAAAGFEIGQTRSRHKHTFHEPAPTRPEPTRSYACPAIMAWSREWSAWDLRRLEHWRKQEYARLTAKLTRMARGSTNVDDAKTGSAP